MAYETTSPAPSFSGESRESQQPPYEIFERFRESNTKIAIQKDGELTDISRKILGGYFGIDVPAKDPTEKRLIDASEDGEYGFVYARNKGICELVAKGAVDLAVVGTDRLIEDDVVDQVEVVASYEEQYTWPLVLATPQDRNIQSIDQIGRVATQYPRIVEGFFEEMGREDIEIIPTAGSTELYPYLDYSGPIDAVVDMCITGKSMDAHRLVPWAPALGNIYPVLIRSREG